MKYFWLIFLSIFTFSYTQAEFVPDKTPVKQVIIPEKNIDKYKNDKDFVYENQVKNSNFLAEVWDWIKRKIKYAVEEVLKWIFGIKTGIKLTETLSKAFPYVVALLFVYLIFRFLIGVDLIRLGKNKKRNLNKVYLSDEERIIQEENLDDLIAKAIKNKQYRQAIRYNYLKILKKLIDKNLIEWHNEKTNRDYVREVSQTNFSAYFKNLTFIYDYVWYGNYQPAEDEFKEIEKDFKSFSI